MGRIDGVSKKVVRCESVAGKILKRTTIPQSPNTKVFKYSVPLNIYVP